MGFLKWQRKNVNWCVKYNYPPWLSFVRDWFWLTSSTFWAYCIHSPTLFLPRSRRCLRKRAVCLCIPNTSQGRKERGGEAQAKISHPAWYVGPLLNAVFGWEPCIWTPAHASWKGNFYFVCLKGNKSMFKKATWGDFSGTWPDWSGK